MNGVVDEFGRAVVTLDVGIAGDDKPRQMSVWIDTAFNGELVLPRGMIKSMGFEQSAGIRARLADGNEVTLESYSCMLSWFGERKAVEVVANDGEIPLLGVGLLLGHRLVVDYTKLTVLLE